MIPDQAIDAAWESILYDARADEDYAFLETIDPEIITDALEAALPHIRAQVQREWADFIDHTTISVGNTLTLHNLAEALRAPHPPFGHCANATEEGTLE